MNEDILDVIYWDITNLVGRIQDIFPNFNSIPQIDKAISMMIDARKLIGELED